MKGLDLEHLRVPRERKPFRQNKRIIRVRLNGRVPRGTSKPAKATGK